MSTLTIEIDDKLLPRIRELAQLGHMSVDEMAKRLLAVLAAPPLADDQLPPLPGKRRECLLP